MLYIFRATILIARNVNEACIEWWVVLGSRAVKLIVHNLNV